jgi:hypothetical protein
VQVTPSFSFGGGFGCSVQCYNTVGKPCAGAYGTRGSYGFGAYARLGTPCLLGVAARCARHRVLEQC